jgi:hypothetical protein
MKGIFELKTPHDLLKKLKYDLEQLKLQPRNSYLAFNFLVTAEHMKDWIYPGRENKNIRENLENGSALLQVCSHVANGAKHFQVEAKHHKSVKDTRKTGGYWGASYWASGVFAGSFWGKGALVVQLEGEAETQFGSSIGVVDLAERIVSFWESRPELSEPPMIP